MTADEIIKAAEARREALRAAHAEAHKLQQAIDIVALVDLEEAHGFERVLRVDIGGWKAGVGAATMVVARIPDRREAFFRRYEQTVAKAKPGTTAALDAAHMLAEACLIYPSKKEHSELHEATMELAAGVLTNLALQVAKIVQGNAEEEKKG